MENWPRQLPWIDGCAGLGVGLVVLALRETLSSFYGISLGIVTFMGVVNVGYSLFGFTLGALRTRPPALLYWLIFANLLWSAACVGLAVWLWSSASIFGRAQLVVEAIFVGGLALIELRYRREILEPRRA